MVSKATLRSRRMRIVSRPESVFVHLFVNNFSDTEKQHGVMVTNGKFHCVEKTGIILLCKATSDLT